MCEGLACCGLGLTAALFVTTMLLKALCVNMALYKRILRFYDDIDDEKFRLMYFYWVFFTLLWAICAANDSSVFFCYAGQLRMSLDWTRLLRSSRNSTFTGFSLLEASRLWIPSIFQCSILCAVFHWKALRDFCISDGVSRKLLCLLTSVMP